MCNFFAEGWTLVTPPILTLRIHRNNVDLHVNSTNKVTVRIRKVKVKVTVKVMIKVKVKFKQRTFFSLRSWNSFLGRTVGIINLFIEFYDVD